MLHEELLSKRGNSWRSEIEEKTSPSKLGHCVLGKGWGGGGGGGGGVGLAWWCLVRSEGSWVFKQNSSL